MGCIEGSLFTRDFSEGIVGIVCFCTSTYLLLYDSISRIIDESSIEVLSWSIFTSDESRLIEGVVGCEDFTRSTGKYFFCTGSIAICIIFVFDPQSLRSGLTRFLIPWSECITRYIPFGISEREYLSIWIIAHIDCTSRTTRSSRRRDEES